MTTSPNDPRVVAAVDTAVRAMLGEVGHVGGDKYWDAVGKSDFRGYAWCGAFQVWGFLQAGVNLMNAAWWYYVPYIQNFAQKIGAWCDESGYGRQAICEWHGDGIADHVGASWPDPDAELFRAVEGNTSMGGSQDNGNGVLVKYRYSEDILGWVDMHKVLAWMIDNGRWDGGAAADTAQSGPTDITALQRAVGADPDNVLGPDTRQRILAVAAASIWGGNEFPFGVEYTQRVVGTTPDGIWGENSEAAHDNTVGLIQAAVGAYQDEIYGAATNAAVSIALAGAETA